jgi:Tol biopolymer transport system component
LNTTRRERPSTSHAQRLRYRLPTGAGSPTWIVGALSWYAPEDLCRPDRRGRAATPSERRCLCLDWSPRGDEIAYGDGSGRQRIIRTDGSKPRPFFRRPLARGKGLPTRSPNGTHVGFVGGVRRGRYFDRYSAIYVADADGSNLRLVTSTPTTSTGSCGRRTGRWILYGRANREGIYVIGADGRNNHRLTRDSPTPTLFLTLTWAPDGRSIAYETDRTGNRDIYLIGADGHNHFQLTSSAASDTPLLATSVAEAQPRLDPVSVGKGRLAGRLSSLTPGRVPRPRRPAGRVVVICGKCDTA